MIGKRKKTIGKRKEPIVFQKRLTTLFTYTYTLVQCIGLKILFLNLKAHTIH